MGTNPRVRPKRLAEKLRYIRASLDLTQGELLRKLDIEELATQSKISEFESGKREPSLLIVLQYSRLAGVHMEDIVDDNADLPAKLPAKRTRR
ncbi:MAG TPA: helix-turn-helix transcriptional regulator [Pyrinomonadaceae bacterium]|jgi:transcriptional regulator with XRE-family HTH domain|nr:helix-turn-helix transcriptional regulator [Pyrinomonadaceae bacterium]